MSALAPQKLEPFTVDHFCSYAERLVLDTGDYWDLEDFQIEVLKPILAGVKEVWSVLPEGNTKTTMMAGFALYHCQFIRSPWVPIVASSRDQAEILARQAYGIIRDTPGLESRFKIYEGYREIRSLKLNRLGKVAQDGRGIKVYAADTATSDGGIPTLVLCDEGHRWPDLGVYRLWKGKLRKRKGQILMISTAGEPGGDFEETRDKIRSAAEVSDRDGAHVCYSSPNIVLNEWVVTSPDLITNMEAVKEANPFTNITVDSLQEEFESPTTDLGDWRRLKPLAVDTPIPTPDGWVTMLDLEVGDRVLNGEGRPTTVRATTPVKLSDCYEVTFSDKSTIVASGDHLWEVEDARNHHCSKIVSTEEMAASTYMKDGRGGDYARWRIRTVGRKVGLDVVLPVDPYVLGVWLGDGSNNTGHIRNGDPEVWDEIEARGYELGSLAPSLVGKPEKRMQTLLKLRPTLRSLDLLNNKHIPEQYLLSQENDRWQLLQGLMDADGTVLEDGRAIFWNTNARLARDVQRLTWSLGLPCWIREERAILNGEDYGPRFAVELSCDSRHPVVRLMRKAERLRLKGKTCDHRRVKSVIPVGKELVRCIAVDAEDSIFLAGEALVPTHNCNIPSRTVHAAVTDLEWERADTTKRPVGTYQFPFIPPGEHIDCGCDVAWKHDTFAISPLWRNTADGFYLLGAPKVLEPPRDGTTLHPDDVKMAFEAINEANPIDAVVIDIERAEDIASWLEDEMGLTIIDRGQGNALAVEDYDAFMRGLRNGKLKHTGDRVLRSHVMNAIARNLPGDKKRFDRPSQSRARRRQVVRVIDALTAAGMVNHYAGEFGGNDEPMLAWR